MERQLDALDIPVETLDEFSPAEPRRFDAHQFRGLLDDLGIAVIVMAPDGTLVDHNLAAARTFEDKRWLQVHRGKVCAAHSPSQERVRAAIAAVLTTGAAPQTPVRLDSRQGDVPLRMLIKRIERGGSQWVVAVFRILFDLPSTQIDILAEWFDLTRRESMLVVELAHGSTLHQAAEKLGISPQTARTHLKRIFVKTGTHTQPQLIATVLQNGILLGS